MNGNQQGTGTASSQMKYILGFMKGFLTAGFELYPLNPHMKELVYWLHGIFYSAPEHHANENLDLLLAKTKAFFDSADYWTEQTKFTVCYIKYHYNVRSADYFFDKLYNYTDRHNCLSKAEIHELNRMINDFDENRVADWSNLYCVNVSLLHDILPSPRDVDVNPYTCPKELSELVRLLRDGVKDLSAGYATKDNFFSLGEKLSNCYTTDAESFPKRVALYCQKFIKAFPASFDALGNYSVGNNGNAMEKWEETQDRIIVSYQEQNLIRPLDFTKCPTIKITWEIFEHCLNAVNMNDTEPLGGLKPPDNPPSVALTPERDADVTTYNELIKFAGEEFRKSPGYSTRGASKGVIRKILSSAKVFKVGQRKSGKNYEHTFPRTEAEGAVKAWVEKQKMK